MRKIEESMVAAVKANRNYTSANTSVLVQDDSVHVSLYDNTIYKRNINTGAVQFCLATYDTATTRSRLRALGIGVYRKNKVPHYNDTPINDYDWYNA